MEHALMSRWTSDVTLDIDPLPLTQRRGLIAVSVMAFLSFLATASLLSFITFRLVFWKSYFRSYIGYNQYIILIYNLVLADCIQSVGFLLCLQWIFTDKIESGTSGCFFQGLFLQIANPGSGLFVLAIAFHTFLLVVWGIKMPYKVFVAFVCGIWAFVITIIMTIPLATHGADIFVPSGAWCWINEDYESLRLWTHYFWIFLAEFGTVCLYAVMYFQLRRQITASSILGNSQIESLKRLRRVVGYMTIYPTVYLILSLPLAAGRMANANGDLPSVAFFCCAGALITSSGLVDVTLYTLTRRNLIIDSEPSHGRSYDRFASDRGRNGDTHLTTITAAPKSRKLGGKDSRMVAEKDGSTDNIVQSGVEMAPIGKVYQETTIEVTSEPAYPSDGESERFSKDGYNETPTRKVWRQ
ncbi:uncharacterized protein N7498_009812 [Penicillium cinerascens]|uniref:G protein-coupled receptor GPR1/2/3 C-terminal domain-containing protein n=1 Tax=Penicillium cinerascens TaxID=70096 RepID=A0A9W9J745_9EURO|nr:uncharacterized protein N7498_009812 [Penicillium cinerascens]KAJ5190827.1 hypothetical protein N7498_009812 [Penicillium cinerascens]